MEPQPGMSSGDFTTEEQQLLQNPVLKNMMEMFIAQQFRSMQTETQVSSKQTGKPSHVVKSRANNQEIKLPLDTTLYAPALQKRIGNAKLSKDRVVSIQAEIE